MVFQDGGGYVRTTNSSYRVPVVFDNLIHRGDMPVTVGVFVNPGHDPSQPGRAPNNRSFEYDTLFGVWYNAAWFRRRAGSRQ